jgi:gamma-glutamylputrescine oxidase
MPYVDREAGNILSVGGYSGHGIAMASLSGMVIADAVCGQLGAFDMMAKVPRHAFPGGTFLRWPLLVLAMTWFSLRDRL